MTITKMQTKMKVKTTRKELVELINTLFALSSVESKKLALMVSKNIDSLKTHLEDVEELATPSKGFIELTKCVQEIPKDAEDLKERVKELESDNVEIVSERVKQLEEVEKALEKEVEIELSTISEEDLPETVTGYQISGLKLVIE